MNCFNHRSRLVCFCTPEPLSNASLPRGSAVEVAAVNHERRAEANTQRQPAPSAVRGHFLLPCPRASSHVLNIPIENDV